MADRAIAHPIKFKADTIAEKLGATDAIRTAFRFTTIGACDLTHAERNKATRKRRTDTKREKRRAEGVMTRGQYEAQSLSRTKLHAKKRRKMRGCQDGLRHFGFSMPEAGPTP
jgi:hypothetical protein